MSSIDSPEMPTLQSLAQNLTVKQTAPSLRSGRDSSVWILSVLLIGLATVEFFAFQRHCNKFVVPFHPINWDQLDTFLTAYDAYFGIVESHKLPAFALSVQGSLLSWVAALFVSVFGPNRFSILLLNYSALVIGQLVLFFVLAKRVGRSCAFLALGLFLLSATHVFPFGGINDMRRDYAGMICTGVSFLLVCSWISVGGRSRLLPAFASFVVMMLTRSVFLGYWFAGLPLAALFSVICSRIPRLRLALPEKCGINFFKLFTLVALLSLLHYGCTAQGFNSYYLLLKVSPEDAMRWRELGVNTLADRLLFYPRSLISHCGTMLEVSACVALVGAVLLALRRRVASSVDCSFAMTSWLMLSGLGLGAYTLLTIHAPSPIVIGALSMPLAAVSASVCMILLKKASVPNLDKIVAAIVLAMGLTSFCLQLKRPAVPPHPNVASSVAIRGLQDLVIAEVNSAKTPPKIYWLVTHEGLQGAALQIRWYETQHSASPPFAIYSDYFTPVPPPSLNDLLSNLRKAGLLIAPREIPPPPAGWFEYPGVTALRTYLPLIRSEIDAEFEQVGSFDGIYANTPNLWSVAVYRRVRSPKSHAQLNDPIESSGWNGYREVRRRKLLEAQRSFVQKSQH